MRNMLISFVIPCYRSEETISGVVGEIAGQMRTRPQYDYEIVVVNDHSPDNVILKLRELAENDRRIKVVDLAKNMGKHAALMAGYSRTRGEFIVSVDDDGQCPVNRLWDLLAPLEEDTADIALAKYPQKKESAFKRFGSKINTLMARFIIGKPKGLAMSNFSAMKRYVCEELLRYKNAYPYIDGLFLRTTSNIANVEMEERERISGASGYTFGKSLKLWLNGFTAFSVKPLRVASVLGLLVAMTGFLYGVYIIIKRLMNPGMIVGYSSIMAVMLLLGGVIMLLLGMIGEYVGRIYISINSSPQYVIRETINLENFDTAETKP